MYLSYPTFQKMHFYEKNVWTDLESQAFIFCQHTFQAVTLQQFVYIINPTEIFLSDCWW